MAGLDRLTLPPEAVSPWAPRATAPGNHTARTIPRLSAARWSRAGSYLCELALIPAELAASRYRLVAPWSAGGLVRRREKKIDVHLDD